MGKTYNKANYQKNTNMVASAPFAGEHPPVIRVKTDGRIGSATPHSELKGGFTVDTGKLQPHKGGLAAVAARHMSPSDPPPTFTKRVAASRAQVAKQTGKAGFRNPINTDRPALKPVKPT